MAYNMGDSGMISIHALREEGDGDEILARLGEEYFYPRPPRGGRPSVSRASKPGKKISIHALREEGDREAAAESYPNWTFLSTPSARRATLRCQYTQLQ